MNAVLASQPAVTDTPGHADAHAVPGAGFADPARGSHAVFRAVLTAWSHPGRSVALVSDAEVPSGVSREAASVLLALLDAETTLWLSPRLQATPVGAWLRFHTGCVLVATAMQAQFAWVAEGDALPVLTELGVGTDASPETAVTLLVETQGWAHASGGWQLTGPGLAQPQPLALNADGPERVQALRGLHQSAAALFPRGVDMLLTAPGRVLGLPRTTRIHVNAAPVAEEV